MLIGCASMQPISMLGSLPPLQGRPASGSGSSPDSVEGAGRNGSAKDRLRLDWVEGLIAVGLGDHEQARQLLARVRQTFLDEGNVYEAALAALDLATSYLKEGKTAEVRELADDMVTVFRNHDVPREAFAALLLFQEAALREAATAELAREVAASLTRARGARALP